MEHQTAEAWLRFVVRQYYKEYAPNDVLNALGRLSRGELRSFLRKPPTVGLEFIDEFWFSKMLSTANYRQLETVAKILKAQPILDPTLKATQMEVPGTYKNVDFVWFTGKNLLMSQSIVKERIVFAKKLISHDLVRRTFTLDQLLHLAQIFENRDFGLEFIHKALELPLKGFTFEGLAHFCRHATYLPDKYQTQNGFIQDFSKLLQRNEVKNMFLKNHALDIPDEDKIHLDGLFLSAVHNKRMMIIQFLIHDFSDLLSKDGINLAVAEFAHISPSLRSTLSDPTGQLLALRKLKQQRSEVFFKCLLAQRLLFEGPFAKIRLSNMLLCHLAKEGNVELLKTILGADHEWLEGDVRRCFAAAKKYSQRRVMIFLKRKYQPMFDREIGSISTGTFKSN